MSSVVTFLVVLNDVPESLSVDPAAALSVLLSSVSRRRRAGEGSPPVTSGGKVQLQLKTTKEETGRTSFSVEPLAEVGARGRRTACWRP